MFKYKDPDVVAPSGKKAYCKEMNTCPWIQYIWKHFSLLSKNHLGKATTVLIMFFPQFCESDLLIG